MEAFDKEKHTYMPTSGGLGMHVEVRDPDDKILMSRVSVFTYFLSLVTGQVPCMCSVDCKFLVFVFELK